MMKFELSVRDERDIDDKKNLDDSLYEDIDNKI